MKRYTRATDWSPLENLANLGEEISRFVDASSRVMSSEVSNMWGPPADVIRTPTEIQISVELPGFQRDEIRVSCEENDLIVSGARPKPVLGDDEEFLRHERRTGSFQRTIALPQDADKDAIKANLRDGVLNITLPRTTRGKAVDIEIEEG